MLYSSKAARLADRAAKKQANREAWLESQANAVKRVEMARQERLEKLAEAKSGNSIASLRAIMQDENEPIARRSEAAEALLSFELAPGSLATSAAAEHAATDGAYAFLKRVAGTEGVNPSLLLRVLKTLASVEAVRAGRTDPQDVENRRHKRIETVNAFRRSALLRKGLWPLPPTTWIIRPEDDLDFPPDDEEPKTRAHTRDSAGSVLDAFRALPPAELQRLYKEREQWYLSARITSRPDPWFDLPL